MSIYVGTSEIKNIYVGTTPVKEVYVGTTKVRPAGWTPSANTLAYYPLEQDANDYSGNGNNGTWSGTAAYGTTQGKVCAQFSSSNYINTGVTKGSYPLTIACQFCHTSSSGYKTVMGTPFAWNGAPDVGLCLRLKYFYFRYGNSQSPEYTISLNTWHFAAIRIYANGNVKATLDNTDYTYTTNSFSINEPFYIGAGIGNKFNGGGVKNVAIWNTSITDEELQLFKDTIMA